MGRAGRLGKAEIDRVFRGGAVAGGPFFVVRAMENDQGRPRWAFAVGRKSFPGSVERNRARRRLRAAAAAVQVTAGADIVVVARRGVLAAPFRVLVEELNRVCGRLGLQ